MHAILGGLGNVDQCRTAGEPFFERRVAASGSTSRDNFWRIYWIDTTGARLFPPVVGSFDGPVGTFRGEDTSRRAAGPGHDSNGTARDPGRPHWHQAFSADGGESWEINWHMSFRRPGAA